jgi:D-glycero-alpha-D-manno-heptose-7-phosphate kinase
MASGGAARAVGLVVTQTPLRISFAGGGTDLPAFYGREGGAVLSTAINQYVYVTVKRHGPVFDERIRLNYSVSESVHDVSAVRNDIARECLQLLEIEPPIYASVVSDLPDSSGLGGSSAFAVGLLNALHTFRGERVSARQLADEACRIEMDILGQPIGKQDQYAVAAGGLNLLTFSPNGDVGIEPQPVEGFAPELFDRLLLLWTGHQRRASSVLEEQRARTDEHASLLAQIRDQAYALQDLLSMPEPDFDRFAAILHTGWLLKRQLASNVSNEHIDRWYAEARQAGAGGGKLCGAGGVGFVMIMSERARHDAIVQALPELTSVAVGFEPHGSRVLLAQLD